MKKLFTLFATVLLSALSLTANAATATVYIDKPAAVDFWIDHAGDWQTHSLQADVANTIEFNAATESTWEFDPINQNTGIYEITQNGVKTMVWTGEGYELTVKDGDVIRVTVERPAGPGSDCHYTIVHGAEAIASVENADTEDYYTLTANAFDAQPGDRIVLRPSNAYEVTAVTLDGAAMQYIYASGCYFFQATEGDHTISVEATKKVESQTITINCNNLDALSFYTTDFYFFLGSPVALDGNKVKVTDDAPYLQIKVSDDYQIVSAVYTGKNGKGLQLDYNQWDQFYYVNAIDEQVTAINITVEEKQTEKINATIWVEDASKFSYYFIRTADSKFPFHSNGTSGANLQTGENQLTINADQNPIRVCFTFANGQPFLNVYRNGEPVSGVVIDSDNDVFGNFTIADGDYIRIYTSAQTVTAIESATTAPPTRAYTIQGTPVDASNLRPGLYIIDGRKTIVK